jgi:hypothetical protein
MLRPVTSLLGTLALTSAALASGPGETHPDGTAYLANGLTYDPALFIQFISGRLRAPESAVESGC